jgi:hypothetical protein
MVDIPPPSERSEKFAVERSHKASEIAYDLSKATGQACMLINGGAATAVIALLAKEKVAAIIYTYVPFCLGGYALGVLASAAMLFCVMMNADYWNYFWYYISYENNVVRAKHCENIARRWQHGMYATFISATALFIASSILMAYALSYSQPK